MNSNARLALIALILAVVLIGGFFLSTRHAREVPVTASAEPTASTTPTVTFKDSYKKGVHTLTGSVMAPNACSTVTVATTVAPSSNPQILLDLSMPTTEGICLEVPTPIAFTTTVTAAPGLPVVINVNGAPATTTP